MIIWVLLFSIVIIVSLILALRSMRNYQDIPLHSQTSYSLFLIKNEDGLTEDLLKRLSDLIGKKKLIVSFEKLFKGSKKALVIYGPLTILQQFSQQLDLMELEDYSLKNREVLQGHILSWEVSAKYFQKNEHLSLGFTELAKDLSGDEEIWWQLILQPRSEGKVLQPMFKAIIRIAVISTDKQKRQDLKLKLEKQIKESGLLALPQAFSSTQVLEFYQQRSIPQKMLTKDDGYFMVSSPEVKYLLD